MASRETVWTGIALASRTFVQALLTATAAVVLDPKQGGLWFVFTSLGGLVQLLDLGLGPMILRAASQLQAGSARLVAKGLSEEKTPQGAPNSVALGALYATTTVVYLALGAVVLLLAGLVAWKGLPASVNEGANLCAWGLFALAAALQLMFSQRSNFLQGVGRLVLAQQLTTIALLLSFGAATVVMVVSHSLLYSCAALGAGWAAALFLVEIFIGEHRAGRFEAGLLSTLWPNTLRMGILRLAFASFYYLPVLLIAARLGVETAGSYGFTVQVCLLLTALAQLPIASWLPQLNALVVSGPAENLREDFCKKIRQTMALYLAGAFVLVAVGPFLLKLLHAKTELLELPMLAFLAAHFFFEEHRNNHVMVANAFNRLDFWKVDVASALILFGGAVFILGSAPFWAYLAWMACVAWGGNFWVAVAQSLHLMGCSWREYRRRIVGA